MKSRALAQGLLVVCVFMVAGGTSSFLAASQAAVKPLATVQMVGGHSFVQAGASEAPAPAQCGSHVRE
jgi:hypothetical protein